MYIRRGKKAQLINILILIITKERVLRQQEHPGMGMCRGRKCGVDSRKHGVDSGKCGVDSRKHGVDSRKHGVDSEKHGPPCCKTQDPGYYV